MSARRERRLLRGSASPASSARRTTKRRSRTESCPFLCVSGSPVYRLGIAQADIFGTSFLTIDNQNLPGGLILSPGDTYNAQLWYRDSVGAGFNLSNGIEVNFCP